MSHIAHTQQVMAYASRDDLEVLAAFTNVPKNEVNYMTGTDILRDLLITAKDLSTSRCFMNNTRHSISHTLT